jgi:DNA modification methylase
MLELNRIHHMDCLDGLPALEEESVQCAVTSVPYLWLRSYGIPPSSWPRIRYSPLPYLPDFKVKVPAMTCCLGEEPSIESFIGHLVHVFRLLRPVLRKDGLFWLNIADRYETNSPAWGGKASYRRDWASGIYQNIAMKSGLAPKNIIATSWPAAMAPPSSNEKWAHGTSSNKRKAFLYRDIAMLAASCVLS